MRKRTGGAKRRPARPRRAGRDPRCSGSACGSTTRSDGQRAGPRRQRPTRRSRRTSSDGDGFTVGRRRDAAVEQLLARPAAAGRRHLRADRRRPRRAGADRAGADRLAGGPLHLPDRQPAAVVVTPRGERRRGRRPDRRGRGGDLPGAARVPGDADERAAGGDPARPARCWRCSGRATGQRRLARLAAAGRPARARSPWSAPSTWPSPSAGVWSSFASRASRGDWQPRRSPRAAMLLAGVVARRSRPGRCATRSRSTASCRSRPAAARCFSPAPTCPRTATRKRSAPRWSPHTRTSSSPADAQRAAPRADPRPARRRALSRTWKPTRRSRRMGARTALGRRLRRAARVRGLRRRPRSAAIWSHGPRDVMREPLWEALHWALVALGLLGLGAARLAPPLGGAADRRVFLAITALSALLVASPRRVLVMLPLVAALAGVGAWPGSRLAPGRPRPG